MAELIVNTEAVLHNYRHYAENGQVIPVLKSNGYALGAKQLQTLLAQRCLPALRRMKPWRWPGRKRIFCCSAAFTI